MSMMLVYDEETFKCLPFYDIIDTLLNPSLLVPSVIGFQLQNSSFTFNLSQQQATDLTMSQQVVSGFTHPIQIRLYMAEKCSKHGVHFPISIHVNFKKCDLHVNRPHESGSAINITALCDLSPSVSNQMSVLWGDCNRKYSIGVFLVRKLTAQILLQRLKRKGVRHSDKTRSMIKEKLSHDSDSEIKTTSLNGSLLCPLGKMSIQIPCRAITCDHIQCFDALLYLQMNEMKPTWVCPVCDKPALFSNLTIDGLFNEIIKEAPIGCNEVRFEEDGSWTPAVATNVDIYKTLNSGPKPAKKRKLSPDRVVLNKPKIFVVTIDSSDDDDEDDDDDIMVLE